MTMKSKPVVRMSVYSRAITGNNEENINPDTVKYRQC